MDTIRKHHGFGGVGQVCLAVLLLVLTASAAHAAVWYVNKAYTAVTPDGRTWATAYPTIQPAVNAAVDGDEIWVAKGTYTGTGTDLQVVNFGSTKSYIALYGGFLGVEPDRGQRGRPGQRHCDHRR